MAAAEGEGIVCFKIFCVLLHFGVVEVCVKYGIYCELQGFGCGAFYVQVYTAVEVLYAGAYFVALIFDAGGYDGHAIFKAIEYTAVAAVCYEYIGMAHDIVEGYEVFDDDVVGSILLA